MGQTQSSTDLKTVQTTLSTPFPKLKAAHNVLRNCDWKNVRALTQQQRLNEGR